MIRYALLCLTCGHGFEAWFGSSLDYDNQAEHHLINCPLCSETLIRKQIMTPSIIRGSDARPKPIASVSDNNALAKGPVQEPQLLNFPVLDQNQQQILLETALKLREHIEKNCEDVGHRFAQEARDMHEGLSEERAIYGQANEQELRDLMADGIEILPLPPLATPRKGVH